jgi:Flp pilus assembly protein TadG
MIGDERRRGQALAEFALTLPIMLLLFLGLIETGFLLYARESYHDAAATLAEGLASGAYTYPSATFTAVATDELARARCTELSLTVTQPGDGRAIVDLSCQYRAMVYPSLSVPVGVEASR